jgi:hypothetical protein
MLRHQLSSNASPLKIGMNPDQKQIVVSLPWLMGSHGQM